ncbi:MAG: hypothetical protein ACREQ9_01775 [Candidatus Binatia bacterium]
MKPGSRDTGPVFAVGRQAFVEGQGSRERVPLLDEKGAAVLGALTDGAEVEILAWIPRGIATRYCVRSTKEGLVGWVGAASLRPSRTHGTTEGARKQPPVSIPPQMPGPSPARLSGNRPLRPVMKAPAAPKAKSSKRANRDKRSG